MHLSAFLAILPLAAAQLFSSTPPANLHNLNLTTTTTFPQVPKVNSHIRLLNGAPVPVLVSLTNNELFPITINSIGASLWTPDGTGSVKNFTIKKVGKKVKPRGKFDVHYALQTDLKEQEALLNVNLAVTTDKGEVLTVNAWKNLVAVREDTVSLLDPQVLFLYLLLAAGLGAAGYTAYSAWAATLPKPKRKYDTPKPVPVVSTGVIDQSWIPEHHLKKTASGTKVRGQRATKA